MPPVVGALEATTSGPHTLAGLDIPFPVFDWNSIPLKDRFHNRFHVGNDVWPVFREVTWMNLCGRSVLVVGYGPVGKGIAERARNLGATVHVVDLGAVRLMEAQHHGCIPVSLGEGLAGCQIVATATGVERVLGEKQLQKARPVSIFFNIEIPARVPRSLRALDLGLHKFLLVSGAPLQPAHKKTSVHGLVRAGKLNESSHRGLVVTNSLEGGPPAHFHRTIVDNHRKRPVWNELDDFHRSLDGSTVATVAPANNRANPNGTVGYLLQFHVGVPTGMVADMLNRMEVEHLGQWSVDYLRDFELC